MLHPRPLVLAHRGASGYLPEHTLAGYFLAIEQGADYIEPDLVMTRDGVLVARHENEISGTTDVAQHPLFAPRRTTKVIDGVRVTGWFTEDFTLAELKSLRARERIPTLRSANTRFDGMFQVPSFEEILDLLDGVNAARMRAGRPAVGVYPETKHPSYFAGLGLALERPLVDQLARHGLSGAQAPVYIQSFEVENLRALARLTDLPKVQLMDSKGRPWDQVLRGEKHDYAELACPAGLAGIRHYAQAIGVHKDMILPRDAQGRLDKPTRLVADAHAAGLEVHAWTFRAENAFLPAEHRLAGGEDAQGDLVGELRRFLALGLDAVFSDQPDLALRARDGDR